MIDNDTAVARNFGRLAGQTLKDVFAGGPTTFDDYVEHSIGKVRDAIMDVFPNLQLNGLDDPLENGTFRFTKGTSAGFDYLNLSGVRNPSSTWCLTWWLLLEDSTIQCSVLTNQKHI